MLGIISFGSQQASRRHSACELVSKKALNEGVSVENPWIFSAKLVKLFVVINTLHARIRLERIVEQNVLFTGREQVLVDT
jgi:hypothetical protein